MYTIETRCPFCRKAHTVQVHGKAHTVQVHGKDYRAWQNGKHAQDAFPYLSANERELLISGIYPSCWDNMFPPEED